MDAPERPIAPPAKEDALSAERPDAPPFARPSWVTYAQAGERLGLTPEAVRHRARRSGWRTMPGNDGRTLVLVPDDVEPARTTVQAAVRTDDHAPDRWDEIARAHDRAERAEADRRTAEQRADQAHKRADVAAALADRTLAQLAEATAERAAAAARAERAEAQASAQTQLIANLEREVMAKEESAAHLLAERDHARIEAREARMEAEALRRADEARRGQGRWARLRASWRGN